MGFNDGGVALTKGGGHFCPLMTNYEMTIIKYPHSGMCVLSHHASRLEGGHQCTQSLHVLRGTVIYILLRTHTDTKRSMWTNTQMLSCHSKTIIYPSFITDWDLRCYFLKFICSVQTLKSRLMPKTPNGICFCILWLTFDRYRKNVGQWKLIYIIQFNDCKWDVH